MTTPAEIVQLALEAHTVESAKAVQSLIAASFGETNERPLGDMYSNLGLLGGSGGSFDEKLVEQVTNMQDAVIERLALRKYGARDKVPFMSPASAADSLLAELGDADPARQATVAFYESDGPARTSKRLTAVFRDYGVGMTPYSITQTAFRLGGSNKDDAYYLQGAFGLGGALTYRNAGSVVVVTRRAPELLAPDEEDRIGVAVIEWRQLNKGSTALYLVDRPWNGPGDYAETWSCPADEADFAPGTHIALISYRVEGIYRDRESDEKSFPSILRTRLYRPVMPVTFANRLNDRGRNTAIRGLERALDSSQHKYETETESLVFKYDEETYQLPVTYWLLPEKDAPGGRRSLIAHDHAVLFLSNGQVHHKWTPEDFRNRTPHNKLKDRILVTVDTDDLPIALRTQLFTADRSTIVKADVALRLDAAVGAFLADWEALRDANAAMLRESLKASTTFEAASIGERIGRAILATGFSLGGAGSAGGGRSGGSHGGSTKPVKLLNDPTYINGPSRIVAEAGTAVSRSFEINAPDDFLESRGQLFVDIDHPDFSFQRDVAVGNLRSGRVRVQVALPDALEIGEHALKLSLVDWFKSSGGIGPRLDFASTLEIVDEIAGTGSGKGSRPTPAGGASGGNNVVVNWKSEEDRRLVGDVEMVRAIDLAGSSGGKYSHLAALGDALIPTLTLNEEYTPFKNYIAGRSKVLQTVDAPRERYAIGVGVSLMLLHQHIEKQKADGLEPMSDESLTIAHQAIARGVLAVMPSFDELAKEAGIES